MINMGKDLRTIYIEFHQEANRVLFTLFNEFQHIIEVGGRRQYDSSFLAQKGDYILKLKETLEQAVKQTVSKYENSENPEHLRLNLTAGIGYYVREFTRKSGLI